MKKCLYFVILILSCGVSFAEEPVFSEDTIHDVTIHTITTRSSDYHSIYITGGVFPAQDPACSHNDRAIIVGSDPGSEAMLSAALTAYATGRLVTLQVSGCVLIHPDTTNTSPYLEVLKISGQ